MSRRGNARKKKQANKAAPQVEAVDPVDTDADDPGLAADKSPEVEEEKSEE